MPSIPRSPAAPTCFPQKSGHAVQRKRCGSLNRKVPSFSHLGRLGVFWGKPLPKKRPKKCKQIRKKNLKHETNQRKIERNQKILVFCLSLPISCPGWPVLGEAHTIAETKDLAVQATTSLTLHGMARLGSRPGPPTQKENQKNNSHHLGRLVLLGQASTKKNLPKKRRKRSQKNFKHATNQKNSKNNENSCSLPFSAHFLPWHGQFWVEPIQYYAHQKINELLCLVFRHSTSVQNGCKVPLSHSHHTVPNAYHRYSYNLLPG